MPPSICSPAEPQWEPRRATPIHAALRLLSPNAQFPSLLARLSLTSLVSWCLSDEHSFLVPKSCYHSTPLPPTLKRSLCRTHALLAEEERSGRDIHGMPFLLTHDGHYHIEQSKCAYPTKHLQSPRSLTEEEEQLAPPHAIIHSTVQGLATLLRDGWMGLNEVLNQCQSFPGPFEKRHLHNQAAADMHFHLMQDESA